MGEQNFLTLRASYDGKLEFQIQQDITYTSLETFHYHQWTELGMAFEWNSTITQINLYANNDHLGSHEYEDALLDSPEYVHVIGAEQDYQQNQFEFFVGFMYSFKVLQYVDEEYE